MSTILTPNDLAERIIDEYSDSFIYETATSLLYHLQERGFCIWQTYTKDDIKLGLGRKPTKDELADMQDRLMNCFEYIRP